MKNILVAILALTAVTSCAFNSVFFPIDTRPDDPVDSTFELIELTAEDGLAIQHYLIKPKIAPKATLFVLHGSGSKVLNWVKVVKPFVEDGYQVFMMEYRGFGNAKGTATHDNVATDALAALEYLQHRPDVKNKPLILLGQSYGGQPAIYATAYNKGKIDGLVLEGTFASFSEQAAFSSPWPVSPLVQVLVSDSYIAKSLIKEVEVPVLLIHSKEDRVVPFQMAEELLRHTGDKVQLWEINGKHVSGLTTRPEEYVSKINQVFADAFIY